jgi:hypothetical protein
MKLKDTSVVFNRTPYTEAIERAADLVWGELGLEPTCTSGNDGKHGVRSLHYADRALDLRFWDVLEVVAQRLRAHLPEYYDVIVESDHVHVEADRMKEQRFLEKKV